MKVLLTILVLLNGLLSASGQKFKGHEIGETTADFLTVEPNLKAKLIDCQTSVPRALMPEEIRKRYGKKTYEDYLKRVAEDKANPSSNTHVAIMDKDPDLYGERCGALINSLEKGTGTIDGTGFDRQNLFTRNIQERATTGTPSMDKINLQTESIKNHQVDLDNRHFVFRDGTLRSFSLSITADFFSVKQDVTQRLGVPPEETSVPYHNAYGATWTNLFDEWTTDNLHVELSSDNNPAKLSRPHLSVETRSAYDAYAAAHKNRPSSID